MRGTTRKDSGGEAASILLLTQRGIDMYVTLRIDPNGGMWVITPPNGSAEFVSLSGLSFHLGS